MMQVQLSRNPFARYDLVRESCGNGKCTWCGQSRKTLFRYGLDYDRVYYRGPDWFNGQFCNLDCHRAYNGEPE
jgi:hypothetical protein